MPICHALSCDNETDETFFYCDSNRHNLCGDCLIPMEECGCVEVLRHKEKVK